MPYLTAEDIRLQLGTATLLTLADDDNDGQADADVLAALIERADAWVDSWIAHNYEGPFPVTGSTPKVFREASLYKAIQFLYMRRPEFVRSLGADSLVDYEKMSTVLLKNLAEAVQRAPDYDAETDPVNVGVTVSYGVSDDVPDGVGGGAFSEGFGDF